MSERVAIGEAIIAGIGASDNALDQVQDIIDNLAKAGFVIVPREPTGAMLKAACASMSPGKRPAPDWVNVKQKHRIRYGAMINAALAS